ncbi:transposase [Bradyrhizobium elkanii]
MNQIIRIGIDTSKYIFVLHGVDAAEQVVLRKKLSRKQVLEFFAKFAADRDRDGGLRGFATLGAGAFQARSRSEADGTAIG